TRLRSCNRPVHVARPLHPHETSCQKGSFALPSLQKIVITEIDRSRLQAVIDRARQFGDESRERLDDLERELMRAEIVDAGAIPEGVVVMNATVTLRDLDCNETETYTLVYPKDADISRNR